jgi:hypothetical protein
MPRSTGSVQLDELISSLSPIHVYHIFLAAKVLYKRHLKAVILTSVIHGSSFRGQINRGLITRLNNI